MKKRIVILASLLALIMFFGIAHAAELPQVSNPTFILEIDTRTLSVEFDYANVVGDITHSAYYIVISIKENDKKERFHFIKTKSGKLDGSQADNTYERPITSGRVKVTVVLPDSIQYDDESQICGFGLSLVDASGRFSNTYYQEFEIAERFSI